MLLVTFFSQHGNRCPYHLEPHNIQPETKRMRKIRMEKIEQKERKRRIDCNEDKVEASKRGCLSIELTHSYLYSSQGMVSFTPEYIQHLKESYINRSYLGLPTYSCKYCNAVFWFSEKNKIESKKCKEITYSNCC